MKLTVHVGARPTAVLEARGDFQSVLTYYPDATDIVSLTMPIRTESYVWDDQLHPIFQMNLPEGFLLQVLQEQFGPHIGASPIRLLAVIGRNTIGRLRIVPENAPADAPPRPIDVRDVLDGDNSEQAFAALVREHAASGVSGVVPKFLDTTHESFRKATLLTHRHIIKGSSSRLPHAALNEHFCMEVARHVAPTAVTRASKDGNALIVDRFDVDENGQPHWGMEDFCALLGLRPANKYETTWERIAKAVRDHVRGDRQRATFERLTALLLLTYALRNADCHSKNVALRYTSRDDAELCPVYDMLTTAVYEGYENNPPGITFLGKKTWNPGRHLSSFVASVFGIEPREQKRLVDQIATAITATVPAVRDAMKEHPTFGDTGKRMLLAWRLGIDGLRDDRVYAMPAIAHTAEMTQFSPPVKRSKVSRRLGQRPLRPKPRKSR